MTRSQPKTRYVVFIIILLILVLSLVFFSFQALLDDPTDTGLYIVLAAVGAAAVAGVSVLNARKKNKQQ